MKHTDKSHNGFGQLTRFWRSALELSQAQLAERAETTPRHVSFLETGRSRPTRKMVIRLASALELEPGNTNALLIAGGFATAPALFDLNDSRNVRFKQVLEETLKQHEPYPALIINKVGDIVMCNRAWLAMLRSMGLSQFSEQPSYQQPNNNLFHLYFSSEGLKQNILNWEELACFILVKIKEQQLITADKKLKELCQWIEAYPDLPNDWAKRAKKINYASFYDVKYQFKNNDFHSRIIISGIDYGFSENPSQLIVHSFLPQNKATKDTWKSLDLKPYTGHSLVSAQPE